MSHEHTHKCQIEDDPLHQHPHEGDKEEVVEKDSYDLTVERWTRGISSVYTSHKYELGNAQTDAQIYMDTVPHGMKGPGGEEMSVVIG